MKTREKERIKDENLKIRKLRENIKQKIEFLDIVLKSNSIAFLPNSYPCPRIYSNINKEKIQNEICKLEDYIMSNKDKIIEKGSLEFIVHTLKLIETCYNNYKIDNQKSKCMRELEKIIYDFQKSKI